MEVAASATQRPRTPRPVMVVTRSMTVPSPSDMSVFQDPATLAGGLVMILGLDAVADRLASEWQGRRVEVYDRVSRTLTKRLGAAFTRLSETDYMVAAPGLGLADAEDRVVRALREIVEHFTGEASAADLRLFRAERVCDDHVVCAPLDVAEIIARGERRLARTDLEQTGDLLAAEAWAPFVTSEGRTVRPSCVLEPVFEISSHTRIGYRLRRRLIDVATGEPVSESVQRTLSRADILRIDKATLARGVERLQSAADHEAELSLILPVSYFSLTHPEAGVRLSQMFAQARRAVRAGVICEIYDIEGIAPAQLAAVTALVRPWSLFVVGYLADEQPRGGSAIKAAGIQVLSFSAPAAIESDAQFIGWARSAIKSAKRVCRSVMVYGCQGQRRLAMAGLLGGSHASLSG